MHFDLSARCDFFELGRNHIDLLVNLDLLNSPIVVVINFLIFDAVSEADLVLEAQSQFNLLWLIFVYWVFLNANEILDEILFRVALDFQNFLHFY